MEVSWATVINKVDASRPRKLADACLLVASMPLIREAAFVPCRSVVDLKAISFSVLILPYLLSTETRTHQFVQVIRCFGNLALREACSTLVPPISCPSEKQVTIIASPTAKLTLLGSMLIIHGGHLHSCRRWSFDPILEGQIAAS
ncbi:hypothetical protein MPTK1_7g10990 [Marchantia polymorpha subsp. ruderalis]|uniref:Uncharacterized protein n=2 Tax=Marchantia polymorpha TaxID=3197 RepID=A0AAF6BYA0_MARPO|nr:hypothetical protein MARPO_0003s0113 [Marchantia polymorpha]BBN16984.1 hypothetical protein Mp_7g10990 [Marchantia polymorpha subsp. ruderalis]|eukprot:PTQ49221.1 hypothetical protein MARPO_0003s0113 [Marchantia polymorpha]